MKRITKVTIAATVLVMVVIMAVWIMRTDMNKVSETKTETKESPIKGVFAKINDKVNFTERGYTIFGKWMINTSKVPNYPADWLARKYPDPGAAGKYKNIIEPINIIIVDDVAKNAAAAVSNFDQEVKKTEYSRWPFHSSGYKAFIKDDFYWQLFNGGIFDATCYQTNFPLVTNNHGRVFGPAQVGSSWIFTAAFSRERAFTHDYISFVTAARDFAGQLDRNTGYKNAGTVDLENVIESTDQFTGDHDGKAIVLRRK